MGVCKFKTSEIKRCVNHALNSTKWKKAWGGHDQQPALFFVHDHGIYCMSNGDPRDMIDDTRAFSAYAKGCNPHKDKHVFDKSRELVGGDDFVETIPVKPDWLSSCDQYQELSIQVTENKFYVLFTRPRKVKSAA